MNKMILTAFVLLSVGISLPACAEMEHRHGSEAAPAAAHQHGSQTVAPETMRMDMGKMNALAQQMQDMRKKIETEKDPAVQKELMSRHMRMLRDGMNMMTTMKGHCMMMGSMGGKGMMKHEQPGTTMEQDTSAMPMSDRMAMMEKKMATMEKTMGHGGMMGQGGMMDHGGMMGQDGMMCMMESRMGMMQEILNGLMVQQEMMMK